MKKSRIILVVVSVLIIIVSIIGISVHINNKKNFKSKSQEKYMATIVMKGFELNIPDKYMATYDPDMGLMYWNNDEFNMMFDVVAGDYEEDICNCIDELNDIMEEELAIIRPYSVFTINGKSYIYMLYYEEGLPTIHCYTKADSERIFEVMVLCDEMAIIKPQTDEEIRLQCEELIAIADSVLSTSKPTDKDDSPAGEVFVGAEAYEQLYSEVEINVSDKYIDHDYIQSINKDVKINFGVKENYYCTGSKSKDGVNYLKFYSDYDGTMITVYLVEKYGLDYSVKSHMEEGCKKWAGDNSQVLDCLVNDHLYYYYTYETKIVEDNKLITKNNFVAACDMGDGLVYIIECGSDKKEVTYPDFYRDFMNVK